MDAQSLWNSAKHARRTIRVHGVRDEIEKNTEKSAPRTSVTIVFTIDIIFLSPPSLRRLPCLRSTAGSSKSVDGDIIPLSNVISRVYAFMNSTRTAASGSVFSCPITARREPALLASSKQSRSCTLHLLLKVFCVMPMIQYGKVAAQSLLSTEATCTEKT